MNQELTNQIIRHVFHCFGLKLPGKINKFKSIMDDEFILTKKISFEDGEKKNIWGIQLSLDPENTLSIFLADLSDGEIPEYAMVCYLKDSPAYGCYLAYKEYNTDPTILVDRAMIACNIHASSWAECNVYMQGAFLCAMEKTKEITSAPLKIEDESQADKLVQFIEFHQNKMEMENEGQED